MTRLLATAVTLFRARPRRNGQGVLGLSRVYFLFAAGVFVGVPGAFDPGQGVDFPAFPRAPGTGANLVRGIGVDTPCRRTNRSDEGRRSRGTQDQRHKVAKRKPKH